MRPYHSPSSIELGDKCRRAWGYRYLEGLRYGEQPWQPAKAFEADFKWPEWVDVKAVLASPEQHRSGLTLAQRIIGRQRSSAFGKAMHSIGEGWYHGEDVAWNSEPGKVFLSGTAMLPHPSRCHAVRIEQPIGGVPYTSAHLGETMLLEAGGIHFMGYIDLEVYPHESESARLGLPPGWAVIDYKSTKDLRWAKKAEELQHDAQASIYAYAHAHSDRGQGEAPPQRWVYFQTQDAKRALAVDVRPTYKDASSRVHLMVDQAKRLDILESIDQCMPNPSACPEFGGCEFHISKGGPCTAERRLGAAVNQVVRSQAKDRPTMPDQTPAQSRFQQLAAARRGGQAAPAAVAPAPAPVVEAPPEVPAPAPAPVRHRFPGVNSFGAPAPQQAAPPSPAPAPAPAPRARRAPAAAPPPPVQEAPAAPPTAPTYKFTIECQDPAELAAIVDIVQQALAQ